MAKFQIIGSRIDYNYNYGGDTRNETNVDKVVATFNNKKDAHKYIKDSELKNSSRSDRPFRASRRSGQPSSA